MIVRFRTVARCVKLVHMLGWPGLDRRDAPEGEKALTALVAHPPVEFQRRSPGLPDGPAPATPVDCLSSQFSRDPKAEI